MKLVSTQGLKGQQKARVAGNFTPALWPFQEPILLLQMGNILSLLEWNTVFKLEVKVK